MLQEGSIKPLAEHMTGQQFAWLQSHLAAMGRYQPFTEPVKMWQ